MKFLKSSAITFLLFSIIFLFAQNIWAEEKTQLQVKHKDAYILLDNLLKLSKKKSDIKASLSEFKKWERIYIKYSRVKNPTETDIKIFLLMVFIAHEHYHAHTLEESAEDIVPIYQKNREIFLKVLNQNSFLIPATCNQLREYYDLFKRPGKKEFIDTNKQLILKLLGEQQSSECMERLLFK